MKKRLEWGVATTVGKDTVVTVTESKFDAELMNKVGFDGKGKVVRVMTLR